MIEVDVAAYRHDFVDSGALAVAFDTSIVPLTGFQLYTPMEVVLLVNGKTRFCVGPTNRQVAVYVENAPVTMVFKVPNDSLIPVGNCRGEHVEITGNSLRTRIVGVGLPCNVPAFKLFYGGDDEATAKPRYRSVEVSN
jgi:hypothetical protein